MLSFLNSSHLPSMGLHEAGCVFPPCSSASPFPEGNYTQRCILMSRSNSLRSQISLQTLAIWAGGSVSPGHH